MARRTKAAAEQTRVALLDAAADVFLEHGVARSTLEQVARAAGVTRGAVYGHFRDKLDLFLAVDERARLPFEEMIARIAQLAGPDPLGELAQAVADSFRGLDADPRQRRVLTVLLLRCEYAAEMAPALTRQCEAEDGFRGEVRRVFERVAATGGLTPPWRPDTAAAAFQALTFGLIVMWLRGTGGSRLELSAVPVIRGFLASLGSAARRLGEDSEVVGAPAGGAGPT